MRSLPPADYPSKDIDRYLTALGAFIESFADVERTLLLVLEHFAGTDDRVSRALFSGVRADAATKYISRLLISLRKSKADQDYFQELFTRLGHITRIRNDIVHLGTNFEGRHQRGRMTASDFYVTNKRFALNKSRLRETPVSARILDDVTVDLQKIDFSLWAYLARGKPSEKEALEIFAFSLGRPWLYTPEKQSSQGAPRRSKPPKRKRQPRSSRG